MEVQERYFEILKHEIFKDTTLDFSQYKDNYLKRRLNIRMRACGVGSYDKYLRLLRTDPTEYDFLLKDVTINVSQFFRDPGMFRLLEKEVLPLLIYEKVKKSRKVLRFWSAGCATGEEAYSLAILLRDLLAESFDTFLPSIYGTDIDDDSLAHARAGRYLPRQVENVHPRLLKRYFTFDGEMYGVEDDIRNMVRFKKEDLFNYNQATYFDIILCRNVIIYFTRDMQERLFSNFYDVLNLNGYLIIGKTEGIFGDSKDKFEVVNSKERIYQKIK
jgi:chemotaxis protein methyltransferase CheR